VAFGPETRAISCPPCQCFAAKCCHYTWLVSMFTLLYSRIRPVASKTTESSSSTGQPLPPTSSSLARAQSRPSTYRSVPGQRLASVRPVTRRISCYTGSPAARIEHLLVHFPAAGSSGRQQALGLGTLPSKTLTLRGLLRAASRHTGGRGTRLRV
jgi:hypothetical protein